MFVSLSDGRDFMSSDAVTEIDVATGTGSDHVTYELDGNLQTPIEIVFVGSGVKKGGGSIQLTVNIVGAVNDGSSLVVIGVPDPRKPTKMTVNDSGESTVAFRRGSQHLVRPSSSRAPENLSVQSTGTIGPNGYLDLGAVGGSHNDVANIMYSGTNNGEVELFEEGNGGSDDSSADVYMIRDRRAPSAPRQASPRLKGPGNDHLSFTVEQGTDTTTKTNIFAEVIGKTKKDKVIHTGNVVVNTKGSVKFVP